MILPPHDLLNLIRTHHVTGLSLRQLQVLAACELGYSSEMIAVGLSRSHATIRRHIAELHNRIFGTLPIGSTQATLAKWTREHFDCCTGGCLQLFNTNQIFDLSDQHKRARPP